MYRNLSVQLLSVVAVACWCLPALGRGQESPVTAQAAPGKDQIRLMKYFDTDRDRQIDADEFSVGFEMASLVLMLSWDDCDQNGDGAVEFNELQSAAKEARKALGQAEEEEDDSQAVDALASAVPLNVVLDRLAAQDEYADEIADLREAIEDLDDEDALVTYVMRYPKRYPHLTPVIRTWGRYYPVKPALRRHFGTRPYRPPAHVKPARPHGPKKPGKAGVKPRPGPKPKPKPKP